MKTVQIDTNRFLYLVDRVGEDDQASLNIIYQDLAANNKFSIHLPPEQAFALGKEILMAATRMRLGKEAILNEQEGDSGESVQGVSGEGIQRPRKTMLGGPLI